MIEVLVKPGDTVKAEDALVTLESDKATMDVPAPLGGVVQDVAVKVGDKVSEGVGGADAGDRAARRAGGTRAGGAGAVAAASAGADRGSPRRHPPPRPRASAARSTNPAFALAYAGPGVRKLARELGVDLGRVQGQRPQGSHPQGRRRGRRRRRAAAAKAAPAAPRRRRRRRRPAAVAEGRLRQVRPGRGEAARRGSRRSPAPTCIATG